MNTSLRIDNLFLLNFRCFAECEVNLHPELTVFVAENGSGKSAILDAIKLSLSLFVDVMTDQYPYKGFQLSDVRLILDSNNQMIMTIPTKFAANGCLHEEEKEWSRKLKSYTNRITNTDWKDAKNLESFALDLRKNVLKLSSEENVVNASVLPLVAFYGTDRFRLWNEKQHTGKYKYPGDDRLLGYIDCLSALSSFHGSIRWYGQIMNEITDPSFSENTNLNLKLITAVEKAIKIVLAPTEWDELGWDINKKYITVSHPTSGCLPLSFQSDGIKSMIGLVLDIARRCAILNPHLGEFAAEKTPGILLIDEVDMHLHPSWQQQVIELLRQAFPEMQIICSTHSPHVLSTVNFESIRMICLNDGNDYFETPKYQTRGVESADVLAKIMNVNPTPQVKEAIWLSDYRAFIQTGKCNTKEGESLWVKIIKHFGDDHPLITELNVLRNFQEFKKLHKLSIKGDV